MARNPFLQLTVVERAEAGLLSSVEGLTVRKIAELFGDAGSDTTLSRTERAIIERVQAGEIMPFMAVDFDPRVVAAGLHHFLNIAILRVELRRFLGSNPIAQLTPAARLWLYPGNDALCDLSSNGSAKTTCMAGSSTITAEKRCQRWLAELMRIGNPEKSKSDYSEEAREKFRLSGRAFVRAWASAITETDAIGWRKPGPKR